MNNYPPGAAHDPNAPYNQEDPEPLTREVEVTVTLSSAFDLETLDYTEVDTGWIEEYRKQCIGIPELLDELCKYIEVELHDYCFKPGWKRRERLQDMLRSAKGWQEIDIECEQA